MKGKLIIIIVLILMNSVFYNVDAASSGDDDTPPVGSPPPSGGGSGSPQFYDYYIPLVFNESHMHGSSDVVVWFVQPSALITSFAMDKSGTNSIQVQEPTKFTFNPSTNKGLTNGSLIRTTSPVLIVGQRLSQDDISDRSFSYSILSDRMMGFEFIAPADGYINILSSQFLTVVNVKNPSKEIVDIRNINIPFTTLEMKVEKGAYINTTGPANGAFISYEDGTSASMAVPRYLKGDNYVFDGNLLSIRENEIDRSFLTIIPDEPTELKFIYKDGSINKFTIFEKSDFDLNQNLRGINSTIGKIDLSIHLKVDYGGLTRKSMVQLFAGTEMHAAELFVSPEAYSTHYSIPHDNTTGIYTIKYINADPNSSGYFLTMRNQKNLTHYDTFSIISKNKPNVLIADDYLFGISTSPGLANHPMASSASFVNIPLNAGTAKNVSILESTWYRYPNIAIGKIEVIPLPIEEYTGQQIRIEVLSNGSLPVGHFKLTIQIDEEELLEYEYDFIGANESINFEFDRFLDYGTDRINVTVILDIDGEINEINEDDNLGKGNFDVNKNVRLRFSVIMVVILVTGYLISKVRKWLKRQRQINRAHVDVLITEEVEE